MYKDEETAACDTAQSYARREAAKTQASQVITSQSIGNIRECSMSEQAEKAAQRQSELASKSYQAAEFFRSHPEFDTFIKLIRSGAIHI